MTIHVNRGYVHHVTNVRTDGVNTSNANALTFYFDRANDLQTVTEELTVFDLPLHIAEAINGLLENCVDRPALDEEAIRADARADARAMIAAEIANPLSDAERQAFQRMIDRIGGEKS